MRRISILIANTIALVLLIYIQAEFPNLNRKYGIPARYFDAVLLYSSAILVLAIVKSLVLGIYARRNKLDPERTNDNFTLGVRRISSVLGALILFLSLLAAFNVDVKSLFTALSIVAAAFAIVAKDYVTSIINGMILMFTDTINIHDEVRINDAEGKVVNINFISIELIDQNGDIIIIPNNTVMAHSIINYTRCLTSVITVEAEVNTSAIQSLGKMKQYILEKLQAKSIEFVQDSLSIDVRTLHKDMAHIALYVTVLNKETELEKEIKKVLLSSLTDYIASTN